MGKWNPAARELERDVPSAMVDSTIESMTGRQPPQVAPAPHDRLTSSIDRAPLRIHSRMVRSQTRLQWQTSRGPS